jgi:hypothetical protein
MHVRDHARPAACIGIMPFMSAAQPLEAPVGLLPLPRPLMTGEVLDAAFRLFRASLLRCLPYSGLAVLVLELPTLYSTFLDSNAYLWGSFSLFRLRIGGYLTVRLAGYLTVFALSVALLGVITLRLNAVSRGVKPRFRSEIMTVLRRWPTSVIATVAALGVPMLLYSIGTQFNPMLPSVVLFLVGLPLILSTALLAVALPAFWCDGLGPFAAIATAFRISRRRWWRMVGAILATACLVIVFYLLAAIAVGLLAPLMGRADLFLLATIRSLVSLVIGAVGVPFVLAMLVVAYEDLKLRELERRGST